jgi:hypothetical protein
VPPIADCPACKRILEETRLLAGPRPETLAEGDVLYACGACLSVIAHGWTAAPRRASPDGEDGDEFVARSSVLISGASVARALEDLRAEPRDAYERISADPARALLLRVPEVFAIARRILGSRAVTSRGLFFAVTRETRVSGGSVEGYWQPEATDLDLTPGSEAGVERFLARPTTDDEPDIRQWPALLQLMDGHAMLTPGAPVDLVRDEGTILFLRPRRSTWVKSGALNGFRAPLDFLRPDPELP